MNHRTNSLASINRAELDCLAVRRMLRKVFLACLTYILLRCVVIAPLFYRFSADILYQTSWWVNLLGLSVDVLDVLLFLYVFPAMIYALWRGRFRRGYVVPVCFTLMTLLQYVVNYLASCISDRAFPSGEVFLEDMGLILPGLLVEYVQCWAIVGLALLSFMLWDRRSQTMGAEGEAFQDPLPMTKLWNPSHPIQRAILCMALTLLAIALERHVSYILAQLSYGLGLLDSPYQVAADLFGDLLFGVIAYLGGTLLINRWHGRMSHAQEDQTSENQ